MMVALLLVGSLAVDWGRLQLAKTELSTAVDAAGRAAVAYLPSDTAGARTAAISLAAQHTVDGTPLVLQSGDIVFGKWNATTQTLDTSSPTPDAVRIIARRTTSRGTAIGAVLARAGGISSFDLTRTAIVQGSSSASYGLVGLDTFNIQNSSKTGNINTATGDKDVGTGGTSGSIASNGNWNIGSNVSIGGYIYYNTASAPPGSNYNLGKIKMSTPIPTPATPSAGSYTTSNSNPTIGQPTTNANVNISSGSDLVLPGGNYVFNSLNISGRTVDFTGPATIWMYGNFSANNCRIRAFQERSTNLRINFCVASGFNLNSTDVIGVVNAPTTPANINNGSKLYGSIFAKQMSVDNSELYFDTQLGANGGSTTSGSTLVQ